MASLRQGRWGGSALGCALLGACSLAEPRAYVEQFLPGAADPAEASAGGVAAFGLGTSERPVSMFADAHFLRPGADVRAADPHDPWQPVGADSEITSGSMHVGPTCRLCDWLSFYAGVGGGYAQEQDPAATRAQLWSRLGAGDQGGIGASAFSFSAGLLARPGGDLVIGVGYDTFFEAATLTMGVSF